MAGTIPLATSRIIRAIATRGAVTRPRSRRPRGGSFGRSASTSGDIAELPERDRLAKQPFVVSGSRKSSLIELVDSIAGPHGAQPMGDEDDGISAAQSG